VPSSFLLRCFAHALEALYAFALLDTPIAVLSCVPQCSTLTGVSHILVTWVPSVCGSHTTENRYCRLIRASNNSLFKLSTRPQHYSTLQALATRHLVFLNPPNNPDRNLYSLHITRHSIKMRASVLTLIAAASAVSAQSSTVPAPQITDSPAGASYVATLPIKEGNPIRGSVAAVSAPDGKGVKFSVSFSGLPATGGPFMYHIHEKPVPADGNCTGTGAHLDPYKRGEVPICDASKPETCQTGDLSGKFGNITAQTWSQEYVICCL
jgi:hypothetical protein